MLRQVVETALFDKDLALAVLEDDPQLLRRYINAKFDR